MKIFPESIVLKTTLTKAEFDKSEKIREKIDDFTTRINDRLCDKFKEEIMFDAVYQNGKMVFTIDNPIAINEVNKTITKLLDSKKYMCISNRIEKEEVKEM